MDYTTRALCVSLSDQIYEVYERRCQKFPVHGKTVVTAKVFGDYFFVLVGASFSSEKSKGGLQDILVTSKFLPWEQIGRSLLVLNVDSKQKSFNKWKFLLKF